jgi:hypothetical protein
MTSSIRAAAFLSFIWIAGTLQAATFVVNATAPAGGDGSAERPLRSLHEAEEASGAGDTIVIARGSGIYTEGIALERGQTLTASAEPAAAALPIIRVNEQAAITARDAADLVIRDVAIELSGSARGFVLERVSGSVSIRGGHASGSTSAAAIDVDGGDAAINLDAFSIALKSGTAVAIRNRSAGALSFANGCVLTADDGILLDRVTGTFAITGGTIRDVRKRGVAIEKSEGITLREMKFINASTANAIPAATCGNPVPSGEHLACGAAIHLHEVSGVTLDRVTIEDGAQLAINGDTIRDLVMNAVQIRGAGDENNDHGVQLRNVAGKLTITDSHLEGNESRQLFLVQDAGEVAIAIRNTTFRGTAPPNGQQAILLNASNDARVGLAVNASTFVDNFGNAVQLIAAGTASVTSEITANTFRNNAAAVTAAVNDAAQLHYKIDNNKIERSTATALNVHGATSQVVAGELVGNSIDGAVCGGGCSGISVTAIGRGTSSALISGNTIRRADANGIIARAGGDASLRVRIIGNTLREPAGSEAMQAIFVTAGMRKSDRAAVCVDLGGTGDAMNTISGAWNAAGGATGIGLTRRGDSSTLSIARYAGDRTNAEGLSKFVAGRNRGAAVEAAIGGAVTLSDGCPIP